MNKKQKRNRLAGNQKRIRRAAYAFGRAIGRILDADDTTYNKWFRCRIGCRIDAADRARQPWNKSHE